MIDSDGYRPNVGMILVNAEGRVFWARRARGNGWQFPQGGMRTDETPLEAMYRELEEETGLSADHVEVLGATRGWLRYRLPDHMVRRDRHPVCIGQKQVWFLLRLIGSEADVHLGGMPDRVRPLALGRFLVPRQSCRGFQAPGLRTRVA